LTVKEGAVVRDHLEGSNRSGKKGRFQIERIRQINNLTGEGKLNTNHFMLQAE